MSIELHTVDSGNVQAINDGRLYSQLTGAVGGIVVGADCTSSGGLVVSVTSGWGIASGRVFTITAENYTVTPSPSGTRKGRLYVKIDLTDADEPIKVLSITGTSLPALVQQDLSNGGTVYEIELAHYDITTLAVSNLVSNDKVAFAGHAGTADNALQLGGVGANGYTPIGELTQVTSLNPIIDASTADIKIYTMGKLVVVGGSFRFTASASTDQPLFSAPAPITGLGRYSWGAIYKYTSTAVIPVRLSNDGGVLLGASTGTSYTGDYFIKMVYIKA